MKVLVTGGAGFIGAHVIEQLLVQGCSVVVIDNLSTGLRENVPMGVDFFEMDICNAGVRQIFERERFDAVIHLAAQTMVPVSLERPDYDCAVNIGGLLNILEACRQTGVKRVVFASSAAVYGDESVDVPIFEDTAGEPQSFYGLSKLTAEKYLALYHSFYGLEYVILRYANVYGERQGDGGEGGVVGIFARNFLWNEGLTVFGNGEQTRDFVYAGDVAQANWQALLTPNANTAYNISTQEETSVNELAELLGAVTGKKINRSYAPARTGDIYRSALVNNKAKTSLDWRPVVSLREGLIRTYAWLAQNC